MLTLAEAIRTGKLEEFAAQEEVRGVGSIDRAAFDSAVSSVIKERRSEDQTSRPASGDGSTGKRTRRGRGPSTSR